MYLRHAGHKGGRGGGSPPAMPLPPKMEYFMASGPEDECSEVPEDVMDGWPMEDGCREVQKTYKSCCFSIYELTPFLFFSQAEKGSEICMCVKKPPKMIKNMKMMMAMMQMTSSPSMDMMTTMPDVDAVKIPGSFCLHYKSLQCL